MTFCRISAGGIDHMYTENLSPFATRLFINDLRLIDAGMYVCTVGPVDQRFTILVNRKLKKWHSQQN